MRGYLKKEAKTLRPNQILPQWHNVQQSNREIRQAILEKTQELSADPVKFFEQVVGFKPFAYQTEFIQLFKENQFTAARWCRQSGKTFIIAALLLWYATTHPDTAIGIVGPSWRQTKRILSRIAFFTHKLPPGIAFKPQKTQIHFTNGSTIEAFPNNPETIRGPTLNVVYCVPADVKVTLADGSKIPIEQLKSGQEVLSYNTLTSQIQPKKVIRTFSNPKTARKILRITHEFGTLDCTADHRVYTLDRGYIPSSQISKSNKILYLASTRVLQSNVSATESLSREEKQGDLVYDIEVQGNHNFFADDVLVSNCDEMNFIPNDQELYDAILFTLSTTDGKFVCSSTPWNADSLFWKIFNHKNFSNFRRLHVPWEKAMEPNGPLKPNTIAEIKKMFGDDPIRWRREMEAEWAEDENTWVSQSLIASCVGTVKNACGEDLREFNPDSSYEGEFFAGLDLAQTRDYCVLSIVERLDGKLLLRHVKIFAQPTLYASVLGYLKMLQDRWGGFQKIRVDVTREGPSFISDMESAGVENGEGVIFSVPRKSEMASLLKQRMSNHVFFFPEMKWEKLRTDIYSELNVERYDLRKDGTIGYSHPNGSHDDVFWSIALAVYSTVKMEPEPFLAVIPR
jgi:hypothetical protein